MTTATTDGEDSLVGRILLGKLEVLRRIGGGGMGVVYEVEHRLTGHRRALKVVHAKYADRPRFMKRLLREAKVAGTLASHHVVETYDAGRLEDGSAYVLMELLHGRSLYEAMQAQGKMPAARMANIMAQVAEGMAVAHEAGIVHRDLKPENIFLVDDADGDERVKVLDFGVSKFDSAAQEAPTRLTAEGTLVGTPYYMSPEQAGGKSVDARTDIYAMGIILYEGLTGRLPFDADSVGELFVKIGAGECVPLEIRRPDLDAHWHELVHRCFHRDPDQRYRTAEAVRRELLRRAGGSTSARARTISDGGRETVDYAEPLPAPPPSPRVARPVTRGPASEDELDVALPGPPAETNARAGRGLPGWAWAAIGAAIAVAIFVPWQLSRRGPPSQAPTPPVGQVDEAPNAVEPPTALAPAPEDTAPISPAATPPPEADAGLTEPPSAPARPTRENSPASAAGLDPNPYR